MSSYTIILLMFLIISLITILLKARAAKADHDPNNIERDKQAEEKYAALCEEGETITALSRGYKANEYYVLTNKRLLIDTIKNGLQSIPLESITRVKYQNRWRKGENSF